MPEVQELAAILRDPDARSYKKRDALRDLGREAGENLLEFVQPAMQDADRYVREDAAKLLGETGGPQAVPTLIKALEDEDYYVRGAVIKALHEIRDPRAIPALTPLLEDRSFSIRDAAERAIADLEEAEPEAEVPEPSEPTPSPPSAGTEPEREETVEQAEPDPQAEIAEEETTYSDDSTAAEKARTQSEGDPEKPPPAVSALESEADQGTPAAAEADEPRAENEPHKPKPPPIPETTETDKRNDSDKPVPPGPVVPLPELDWSNTPRFKAFFGDERDEIKAVYEEYREARAQLPKQQYLSLQAVNELRLLHADKDDDVDALNDEIERMSKLLQKQKGKLKSLGRHVDQLHGQLKSSITQLMGAFAPSTRERVQEQLEKMNDKRREVEQKIDSGMKKMRKLMLTRKALQEKIGEQEAETAGSEQVTRELEAALIEANREINQRILQRLRGFSDQEMHAVLAELGRLGGDVEFLQFCSQEIQGEIQEVNQNRSLLEPAQAQLQDTQEACNKQTGALGAAIGAGFDTREVADEVKVNLRASLHFEEGKSFWSGYSNASGSAEGRGSARGRYTLQEISWDPGAQLTESVDDYIQVWETLGRESAKVEFLQNLEQAGELSLLEYARFLRSELEKDFMREQA